MRRFGKKGIRSNKSIRVAGRKTYTDRHYFTDSDLNLKRTYDVKIKYGKAKYCTHCGERVNCQAIMNDMNTYSRDKNYNAFRRRAKCVIDLDVNIDSDNDD